MEAIPSFTKNVWHSVRNSGGLHPGLAFYRLFEWAEKDDEKRRRSLERVVRNTSVGFGRALADRLSHQVESLRATNMWEAAVFDAKLATRMAVGMGIPSVSENGLYLDHTHGVPLIPGSSLKGVVQDYARLELEAAGSLAMDAEGRAKNLFDAIFGAQPPAGSEAGSGFVSRKGHVIFFDAFPVSDTNPFDLDIMNPHYGEYYAQSGHNPPADYLNPNPIVFLTVKSGVVFRFALAACKASFSAEQGSGSKIGFEAPAGDLLAKASDLLKGALSQLGVGGKTRVGYGIFSIGG